MRIILDFDRVIFNSVAYAKYLEDNNLKNLEFDPEVWDDLKPTDFFYPDSLNFLQGKPKADLVVISAMTASYGPYAREFQKRKLALSGLEEFASEIIVMEGDKAPYVKELAEEKTIFVDDKLSNLVSVRQSSPEVSCFQMVREGYVPEGREISEQEDIPVIADFAELDDIIKSL